MLGFNPCENRLNVEAADKFNIGDTVLLIQMKGTAIDSSNSATFGSISNFNNAGNYEFNYIKSKTGNTIELKNSLTRQYDIPAGKVQLIRAPYYYKTKVSSTLTCLPWDGSKGGVLVLNVRDTVDLAANIDVSGRGFKGGNSPNTGATTLFCFNNDFTTYSGNLAAAAKGESIVSIGNDKAWGKGAPANGGGGGLGHNSGGGGGANAGAGGFGGYQLLTCGNAPFDNRGVGAYPLTYNNTLNKIFLGGGGGSGHVDNKGGSNMEGGNGGGIAIIISAAVNSNGFKILAQGGNATQCNFIDFTDCHDGSGGGGGGGAILMETGNYINPTEININGGKGGDLIIYNPPLGADKIGPGGGGGAGVAWFNSASVPANAGVIKTGGINGVIIQNSNDPWGSTAGSDGITIFNLKIPVDFTLFIKNIDSIRIQDSATSCNVYDFKGLAFTKGLAISNWQWNFGDGTNADTQHIVHSYSATGTYNVKLVVTDKYGCKDSATKIIVSAGAGGDFSYKQDVCNPLSIQFSPLGAIPANALWLFGDGKTTTGETNPTHLYASPGTYSVKLIIQNGTCVDTITKKILVSIIKEKIILTADTTICFNSAKQLLTKPSLSFCWTPTTYLSNPNIANPVTTTPVSITYFLTAEIMGINLIVNGDFSAGNTGFTSKYIFANPTITEAQYFVGTNPQAWSPLLSPCGDHTTGNGNMMLVNGASVSNVEVWTETVPVVPNTNYAFSTWISAMYPPNPAKLRFSINGRDVGNLISPTLPTCTWSQFYTTWNSGDNISASISIMNKNNAIEGNDFALDDISFSPVLIKRDSVIISVDSPAVKTIADTSICGGKTVQLSATGAATYSWTPSTGLNNAGIANPLATPVATVQYIVNGINAKGCTASDTVNISIKPSPVILKSADSTICRKQSVQLFASGGNSYSWLPAASLSNPAIATPIATPATSTTYLVTVTGANSCSKTDSVKIYLSPLPTFTVSPNKATCINQSVALSAGGGSTYLWSPASLVDNPNISNPVSVANTTITFAVKIKNNTCNDSTTLTTTVTVLPPPTISVTKSNDIDCVFSSAQLTASGANRYVWSPATGLNNANIANPSTTIIAQQQYVVTGTDTVTNCTGTGTITIFIKGATSPTFFIPSAFSPNGDGLNDCFGVKQFGTVKSVDISIYNRFGNLVFHTFNVNDCWDGTYKGSPLHSGNYVYYIKTFNDCGAITKKGNLLLIR